MFVFISEIGTEAAYSCFTLTEEQSEYSEKSSAWAAGELTDVLCLHVPQHRANVRLRVWVEIPDCFL